MAKHSDPSGVQVRTLDQLPTWRDVQACVRRISGQVRKITADPDVQKNTAAFWRQWDTGQEPPADLVQSIAAAWRKAPPTNLPQDPDLPEGQSLADLIASRTLPDIAKLAWVNTPAGDEMRTSHPWPETGLIPAGTDEQGRPLARIHPDLWPLTVYDRLTEFEGLLGVRTVDKFEVPTSQESTALQHSIADGGPFACYRPHENGLIHKRPGAAFAVRVEPDQDEVLDTLTELVRRMDTGCVFAMLYISKLLLPENPEAPLPQGMARVERIVYDDVIAKCGMPTKTRLARKAAREKVHAVIEFGRRAHVVGQRTGTYLDPATKREIPTRIDVQPWTTVNPEYPDSPLQPVLFGDTPVSIEVVATREWTRMSTDPGIRQFLEGGEILAGIPRGQPSGAWAAVIGLAVMNLWRRHPENRPGDTGDTPAKRVQNTRRELLTFMEPDKAPPLEILEGTDPGRAIDYWNGALAYLVDKGILAKAGEAAGPCKPDSRQGWQDAWLDEKVDLRPTPELAGTLTTLAAGRARALRGRPKGKKAGTKGKKADQKT